MDMSDLYYAFAAERTDRERQNRNGDLACCWGAPLSSCAIPRSERPSSLFGWLRAVGSPRAAASSARGSSGNHQATGSLSRFSISSARKPPRIEARLTTILSLVPGYFHSL